MLLISKILHRNKRQETPEEYWSGRGVHMGEGVRLAGTMLDPSYPFLITIGDFSTLSACRVLTHDASTMGGTGHSRCGKVTIGSHCFIGADAIILPGTIIGDYVIIGAGSIVHGKLESNSVYVGQGSSLRKISSYEAFVDKAKKQMQNSVVIDKSHKEMGEKEKSELFDSLVDGEFCFLG